MIFEEFKTKAGDLGLTVIDRGNGHWQVKGKLLVNFYPRHGTVYVAGTTKGVTANNLEEVFAACHTLPDMPVIAKRKQYTTHKRKLWSYAPFCHWCKKKIGYKEATIDHVIPLSKGGLNNSNNYVLACQGCNFKRGNEVGAYRGI